MNKFLLSLLLFVAVVTSLNAGHCLAVSEVDAEKNGIAVSPAEALVEVAQIQPKDSQEITITNNYNAKIRMTAQLKSIDESSGILIPTVDLEDELAKALSVSEADFQIEPKSKKTITIAGSNIGTLSPGGHYASLVLTVTSTDNQRLNLQSALSVNVFFIKADGARVSMRLDELKTSSWLLHITSQANLKLTNDGNVRATPYGVIAIKNRNGDLISRGYINPGGQPLMPNKSITSNVNLIRIQRVWYPQKLTLSVSYHADDYEAQNKSFSFWYIPSFYVIIPAISVVFILIFIRKKRRNFKPTSSRTSAEPMPSILKIAIKFTGDASERIHVKRKPRSRKVDPSQESAKKITILHD